MIFDTPIHYFYKIAGIILIFVLITSGCNHINLSDDDSQSFVIDQVFQEFYDRLGGKQVLGEVISPAFVIQNIKYQYTANAVLQIDLLAEGSQSVALSPVGRDLNIDEDIQFAEGQITGPFLRDFIYPEFFQVYQYLGGLQIVGKPLTGIHYNPEFHRYEQYFENLGFYRLEKDTPGTVYLLGYGAWKCGKKCPVKQKPEASIVEKYTTDPIFVAKVNELGKDFVGFALSSGHQAEDGGYEQIFEYVILQVDMNQPSNITLAPLPKRCGIGSDALELSDQDTSTQFVLIDGENGYNVPKEFIEYLNNHGGLELAGSPISRFKELKDNIYQQCFVNMCLEMDKRINGIFRVRPVPLGYSYLHLIGEDSKSPAVSPTEEYIQNVDMGTLKNVNPSKGIGLQVWEDYPFVTSNQAQGIGVMVYENNQPMINVTPELMVTMVDGSQEEYFFPATDQNGKSYLQLDPTGAPNGTLIPYQVCVSKTLQDKFCVQDNFLIWNNP